MLEAIGLTKQYSITEEGTNADSKRTLFENLSFKAPKGALVVVRGASGSGKSTLLRCIAQLESLTSGDLTLHSHSFLAMRPEEWRTKVVYIPQKCPKFTGSPLDTLREISKLKNSKKSFIDLFQSALDIGKELQIQERLLYEDWSRLSGGEAQKMLNVITIATEPQVVLLDEPTASLDPTSAAQLEEFFQKRRKDLVIFWVTHDSAQEARISPTLTLTLSPSAIHYHNHDQ